MNLFGDILYRAYARDIWIGDGTGKRRATVPCFNLYPETTDNY